MMRTNHARDHRALATAFLLTPFAMAAPLLAAIAAAHLAGERDLGGVASLGAVTVAVGAVPFWVLGGPTLLLAAWRFGADPFSYGVNLVLSQVANLLAALALALAVAGEPIGAFFGAGVALCPIYALAFT
ncbi:MAG: hypothetical protein AAFR16_10395, partial [Pseudomonadota bacterium]